MQNDQLTEQLAALIWNPYDDGDLALDDAEEIIAALDLDHWISPDRVTAKMKALDEGEAKTQRMLAQVEQQRQMLSLTLDQIQGARQVLKELMKEGGE